MPSIFLPIRKNWKEVGGKDMVKGEPSGNTKAFIDFATGTEGQEIVASMKHIKVKK